MVDSFSNNDDLVELYTLREVYDIEFGVRGYWKCIFDNAPSKYQQKGVLASSCSMTDYAATYDSHRMGLINIYTPTYLQMPTLNITFLDDNECTIENWLRDWKKQMRKNGQLAYIDEYVQNVVCFQYSPQYRLLSSSKYLVAPIGKIQINIDESVKATTISMEFNVFRYDDI